MLMAPVLTLLHTVSHDSFAVFGSRVSSLEPTPGRFFLSKHHLIHRDWHHELVTRSGTGSRSPNLPPLPLFRPRHRLRRHLLRRLSLRLRRLRPRLELRCRRLRRVHRVHRLPCLRRLNRLHRLRRLRRLLVDLSRCVDGRLANCRKQRARFASWLFPLQLDQQLAVELLLSGLLGQALLSARLDRRQHLLICQQRPDGRAVVIAEAAHAGEGFVRVFLSEEAVQLAQ
eukprot:scaffold15009_cov62-Phaeocystis_antarctica.AAC.2